MKLGNSVSTIKGQVTSLLSRGKRLIAITGNEPIDAMSPDTKIFPEIGNRKVHCALAVASQVYFGFGGSVQRKEGDTVKQIGDNCVNFWRSLDVFSIKRFNPLGFCSVKSEIYFAAATNQSGKENQTTLARYVPSQKLWYQIAEPLYDFKARALIGYQIPNEEHLGRLPVVFGNKGAFVFESPRSDPVCLGQGKPQDFRDGAVLNDGQMDYLYAVGQAGVFLYDHTSVPDFHPILFLMHLFYY